MFKKSEPEEHRGEPSMGHSEPVPAPSPSRSANTATVGPSICLRGDLSGEEDLVVQGRVEGTVSLSKNLLTIGKEGRVNATVQARVIIVQGEVEGDLHGEEQVVVQRSGQVQGNITAPRVTLEDGCKFKGSIDMDIPGTGKAAGTGSTNVRDLKPAAPGGDETGKGAVEKFSKS